MADVCISYDEKSAESVARQISATLERDGISCWYVGRDMEKGALRGAITEAIEDCCVFLLILSERSIHSEYVKNEIALAVRGFDDNRKRELIAFRVDNVNAEAQLDAFLDELRARDDFPSNIAPFQVADGCPPDAEHIGTLLKQVRRIVNLRRSNAARMRRGKTPQRTLITLITPRRLRRNRKWSIQIGYAPLNAKALKPVLSVLAAVMGKFSERLAELSETLDGQTDSPKDT